VRRGTDVYYKHASYVKVASSSSTEEGKKRPSLNSSVTARYVSMVQRP
jgi:hypothetical protein